MNAILLASQSGDWSSVAIFGLYLTFVVALVAVTRRSK